MTPPILFRWMLLLAAAAPHALPQSAAYAPAHGLYRIAGTVVNGSTGEPVRRATVSALAQENSQPVESVESDNDGHFALERLPAAKYTLTASKRGFRTSSYDEHEGFNTAIVTGEDLDTSGLTFRLMPSAVLYGVVTADGGDPVEHAQVMLFRKPTNHAPGDRITQAGSTTTDDTGAYEFDNLAEGEYLLVVKARPWYAVHKPASRIRPEGDPGAALDVAYPVTYYDSTTDEASATSITLTGGSRAEANINLHAVPALHLLLPLPERQENAGFGPLQLSQPVFGSFIPSGMAVTMDGAQPGSEEINGIAPGHYELTAGTPLRVFDLDATANQTIDPNLGAPTVAVTGTLQTAQGAALAGQAFVSLNPIAGIEGQRPMQFPSNPGSFRFDAVPAGTWELEVQSPGKVLHVVSTTAEGKTHAGDQIAVRDTPLSIVVTVSESETRIEGLANRDDRGMGGVMMVLVSKSRAASISLIRRDQSDSDGSFALNNVLPGQYTVVAIEDGWSLDWSSPDVIGRYLPRGVAVTVTDDSGKVIRLSQPVPVQAR